MIRIRMLGLNSQSTISNLRGKQKEIYNAIENSPFMFEYDTANQLLFELKVRENIINASIDLSKSKAVFSSFRTSGFNPAYWIRGNRGYLLRYDVQPADAIEDIFINSQYYGFECSTAIVIIFYKAVLESIDRRIFNYLFQNLLVWDWNYDRDLQIITLPGDDFIPGDVVYFYNPDFKQPIWMGENAVFLGDGKYFGHGIGIRTAEQMVEALNTRRRENAKRTAYLLEQYSRLNFSTLERFAKNQPTL
ncbi:protein-glutamine gamma-glutamyltransferase [Bacillus methanolicus]|uniref:protein-glutamine gamma-glutamyltransferase n=1 Tax=Bacillus methanolicus TaxID=1471 RepID=UPI002380AABE|nr:protein-glutamine gamma-glutamyltransferase [Bacillus methanolicus]MDE3838289.1 protein-glutamine gamma-glutamyltransferase [Bacillus methanolicus]